MELIKKIFDLLNKKTNYAVARNYVGLPNNFASRDIDILIERKQYNAIKREMRSVATSCGYKVLLVSESERFDSIFFQAGNNIVQFDFFFGAIAFGIIMLSAEEMLQERLFNGSVYYLPEHFQFLEKFLFNIMAGQNYPEKYAELRKKILLNSNGIICRYLKDIFGEDVTSVNYVEKQTIQILRKKAKKQSVKRYGLKQILKSLEYYKKTINNILFPRGLFISFTGPDGVGKTTVLEMIADTYRTVWSGKATQIHHFRPDELPRIAVLLHRAGAVKTVDKNYENPHRGKNSGILGSIVRLLYYMTDYQIGYWKKIFPRRFRRQVTIYDRYFSDIIIDSERSNIKLPFEMIYRFGNFIPQPEYRILITADAKTILERKDELSKEEILRIQDIMAWLKKKNKKYICIENNGTAVQAASIIMQAILDKQDKKYQKYFR